MPYSGVHKYCTDACGKQRRHILAGHAPRRARIVGTCAWCSTAIASTDGHSRKYHRACYRAWLLQQAREAEAKAERAFVQMMNDRARAAFARQAEKVFSEMDARNAGLRRVVTLPDGTTAEISWDGSTTDYGERGQLQGKPKPEPDE